MKGSRLAALAAVLLTLAIACEDRSIVGRLGDQPLTRDELELYLAHNLLQDDEATTDAVVDDRVKSRLLDALVVEKMLLAEAERRGIEVGEGELELYLASERGQDTDDDGPSPDARRGFAHRRLMVRKLNDSIADGLPPPTEEEVRDELGDAVTTARERLRLRALRFDSPDTASRVAESIRQGSMSFAQAVELHGSGPGQGIPIELSWDGLPYAVRDAMEQLEPSEVTSPVQVAGEPFVFQLESWLSAAEVDEDRVRRARREIDSRRRREASEALVRKLRAATPVVIHEARLSFRYVPEEGS